MERPGNREKILAACAKMAGAKGVKFTIDDIETASGLSRRTIYRYFPGKDDILIGLLDETFLEIQAMQKDIYEANALSLPEKLWRLLTVKTSIEEHISPEGLYLYEKYNPRVYQYFQECYSREWSRVETVLKEGMDQGIFRPYCLELVVQSLQNGMKQLCQGDFLDRNRISYHQGLRQLVGMLLRGLVIRPEDLPYDLRGELL